MKEENKFIIVILCYNCQEYIQECIESIVNQKYENYEVIIIDDISTDKTQQVIKKLVSNNGPVFIQAGFFVSLYMLYSHHPLLIQESLLQCR